MHWLWGTCGCTHINLIWLVMTCNFSLKQPTLIFEHNKFDYCTHWLIMNCCFCWVLFLSQVRLHYWNTSQSSFLESSQQERISSFLSNAHTKTSKSILSILYVAASFGSDDWNMDIEKESIFSFGLFYQAFTASSLCMSTILITTCCWGTEWYELSKHYGVISDSCKIGLSDLTGHRQTICHWRICDSNWPTL